MSEGYARFPQLSEVSLDEARAIAEQVRAPFRRGGPVMASTTDRAIDTPGGPLRLRIHWPAGDAVKGALIYLHGGGWTLFSLETHDRLMREYAFRADLAVVGVDYALSPEHKYPVALGQAVEAVRWIAARGAEIGVDPARLALGGDSVGANLALTAAISLRDRGEPSLLRALVLNYGVYDQAAAGPSRALYGGPDYMLSNEEMAGFWRNYLSATDDPSDPLISPIHADLTGLPPVFMAVADRDILRDENLALAARLEAAKTPVALSVYPGTTHSFLEAVSIAEVSDRAFAETAAWLVERLTPAT
jgi:acetyl esterase